MNPLIDALCLGTEFTPRQEHPSLSESLLTGSKKFPGLWAGEMLKSSGSCIRSPPLAGIKTVSAPLYALIKPS